MIALFLLLVISSLHKSLECIEAETYVNEVLIFTFIYYLTMLTNIYQPYNQLSTISHDNQKIKFTIVFEKLCYTSRYNISEYFLVFLFINSLHVLYITT